LVNSRKSIKKELRWLIVGDPNQSIYGFAGANPKSMFEIRKFFNEIHKTDIEVKLLTTHRCSEIVFSFARDNYNNLVEKIESYVENYLPEELMILEYIKDLKIAKDIKGHTRQGDIIIRGKLLNTVSEILKIRVEELGSVEVCCIGVNRYDSIDVFKEFKKGSSNTNGDDIGIYATIYKDYEGQFGYQYVSVFLNYLAFKFDLYNDLLRYQTSLLLYSNSIEKLIKENFSQSEIDEKMITEILIESSTLFSPLNSKHTFFEEFLDYTEKFIKIFLKLNVSLTDKQFIEKLSKSLNKIKAVNQSRIKLTAQEYEITIGEFIEQYARRNQQRTQFDIKYIHKIKGLEYEQVIVQKIEDLPHPSHRATHFAVLNGKRSILVQSIQVLDYIQEINKLYVMLTRSKGSIYIVMSNNKNKKPTMLKSNFYSQYFIDDEELLI